MNRSLETVYAPAKTDTPRMPSEQLLEQFDHAAAHERATHARMALRGGTYPIAVERVARADRERG